MRLSATDGYFNMGFTATLGEELWRLTMEPDAEEEEKFPDALKTQVSLWDCQFFEDGTPSRWTEKRIKARIAACSTHDEYLKRIMGRFVMETGKRFPSYNALKHVRDLAKIPERWLVYGGVDPGSGGEKGHPAAIAFIAVRPDFRAGRVFLAWRGDGVLTTAGDVVKKYIELKLENEFETTAQAYDWAAKDFDTISRRMGETFQKADKDRESGDKLLETLFRFKMLLLYDHPEVMKASREFATARKNARKTHAKDDLIDAIRYAAKLVPWDFSWIAEEKQEVEEEPAHVEKIELDEREASYQRVRKQLRAGRDDPAGDPEIQEEIESWNDLYQGF